MLVGSKRANSEAVIGLWVRCLTGSLSDGDCRFWLQQVRQPQDMSWQETVTLAPSKAQANQAYEDWYVPVLFTPCQQRLIFPSLTEWPAPVPPATQQQLVDYSVMPLLLRLLLVASDDASGGHHCGTSVLLCQNIK